MSSSPAWCASRLRVCLRSDHDNRFAHDISLIFHAADVIHRHDVNVGIDARVKSNPKAFAEFQKVTRDPAFLRLLDEAELNPKGEAADNLLKKVVNFINLTAKKVRWGPRERAAEVTLLMALQRANGAGNIFYSMAPDDVHLLEAILYAFPYEGPDEFPAVQPDAFFQALRGQSDEERKVGGFDMREAVLQKLAADNPIATTLAFNRVVESFRDNLLRHRPDRLTSEPAEKGVFGVGVSNRDVKEANKRSALHIHGQTQGGLSPALLADVAGEPELRVKAMAALDTQLCAELPLEYHAVREAQRLLHVCARRDAAHEAPRPHHPDVYATDDEYIAYLRSDWWPKFLHHARMTVMNKNSHVHMGRCVSDDPKHRGYHGCALGVDYPHDINETRCVELRALGPGEKPAMNKGLPIRCSCCYADGALNDGALDAEEYKMHLANADRLQDIVHTAHEPTRLDKDASSDLRTLALDMRRRLIPARRPPADDDRMRDVGEDAEPGCDMHDDTLNKDGSLSYHAELMSEVREGRERGEKRYLEFAAGPDGDKAAREDLERLIAPGEKLGELLAKPELRTLRERIQGLLVEPRDFFSSPLQPGEAADTIEQHERKRAGELRALLRTWVCPDMVCANARIADHSLVVSGCVGSNAVPYAIGAGAGSKGAGMYSIK